MVQVLLQLRTVVTVKLAINKNISGNIGEDKEAQIPKAGLPLKKHLAVVLTRDNESGEKAIGTDEIEWI